MIISNIRIEKIINRGLGLGFKDDKTIMVYYSIPSEVVDAEILMTKKSYIVAKALNIKQPSPFRVDPICQYYMRCGGCQMMHIDYQRQVEFKRDVLIELFERAKVNLSVPVKTILSNSHTNYRLRAQFLVKNAKVGFTEFNSNKFIKVDNCRICHDRINYALSELNNNISSIELNRLFIATDGKNISTYPIKDMHNRLDISINRFKYHLIPQVFFQANISTLEEFQSVVVEPERGIFAIDFFSGSGFFSIPLSKRFENVLAIEESQDSISLLKRNMSVNNISNIIPVNSTVENATIPDTYKHTDLVILDPPRSGLSNRAIQRVINLQPKKIIYVSCDPATLTRDVSSLHRAFYDIQEVILLDQFPHTFHFETIVKMTRTLDE